jgi:hypothetical protein
MHRWFECGCAENDLLVDARNCVYRSNKYIGRYGGASNFAGRSGSYGLTGNGLQERVKCLHHDFQSCTFDHSVTSPGAGQLGHPLGERAEQSRLHGVGSNGFSGIAARPQAVRWGLNCQPAPDSPRPCAAGTQNQMGGVRRPGALPPVECKTLNSAENRRHAALLLGPSQERNPMNSRQTARV